MKFYMAPLQSYTTSFYRQAHALTYGKMHKYFTPFFEDTGKSLALIKFEPELNLQLNNELNVVPQVATNNASFLVSFAKEMKRRGFNEININMGCPFPMLVKRGRGGGILNYPDKVSELLRTFEKANLDLKLSVKMRLGIDNNHQGQEVINVLNKYQLEELILHPRLVTQKYSGVPDWDSFELFCQQCIHPVVANGDITSKTVLSSLKERFKTIDTFMIGRGLLSSPDLFSTLNNTSPNPPIQTLHQHYYGLITSHYTDWNQAFNFLQSFWHYPLNLSIEGQRLLRKLKKHNKPKLYAEWLARVNSHLSDRIHPFT